MNIPSGFDASTDIHDDRIMRYDGSAFNDVIMLVILKDRSLALVDFINQVQETNH